MSQDKFSSLDSLIAPARTCFEIEPDDATELIQVTKAIYVGAGGDVMVRMIDSDDDVLFSNVPSGAFLPIRVVALRAAGTTASAIVGLA